MSEVTERKLYNDIRFKTKIDNIIHMIQSEKFEEAIIDSFEIVVRVINTYFENDPQRKDSMSLISSIEYFIIHKHTDLAKLLMKVNTDINMLSENWGEFSNSDAEYLLLDACQIYDMIRKIQE